MTYRNLNIEQKQKMYNKLCDIITTNRKTLIEKVVNYRTNFIIPVIENIHSSHNASAVLRTCDCLGIESVCIIENNNTFSITQDISLGSHKWLNIKKYNTFEDNTITCFNDLKQQGYKIVATMPSSNDITLQELPINEKLAIVFGSEVDGISDSAIKNADIFMKIPMYGFTESFNISVSAAIILHYLTDKIRNQSNNWQLNKEEKLNTLIHFALESITSKQKIEKELIKSITNNLE